MLISIPTHNTDLHPIQGNAAGKPTCITKYNYAKKGIDVTDQMGSCHSVHRRGLKWYRKLALDLLLNECIVNAWVIQKFQGTKVDITKFREEVALKLLGEPRAEFVDAPLPRRRLHTLVEGQAYKRCNTCYNEHRNGGTTRANAAKATKKVKTCCDGCQKAMCLNCFNNAHRI